MFSTAHGLRGTLMISAALAVCLPSGGCGSLGGDPSAPPPGELVGSEKERILSPDVPAADLTELVSGNSAFAFDLYHQARDGEGNIFYSPYSISLALAMTFAGARGESEQQMADAMSFTLEQDRLHPAFNALDQELASRGDEVSTTGGDPFTLNIVNRIWGQTGFTFLDGFLDVLAEHYGAALSLLDFADAPEPSRVAINDWVADQTRQRIENLIPWGRVNPLTRLVLTNAIYFKASWREPFEEGDTRDRPFNLLDGGQVTAEMMRQTAHHGHASGEGYLIVELLYDGDELSMVVVVPDEGRFEEMESTLGPASVASMLANVEFRPVDLTMPKFTFEWAVGLTNALSTLGMPIVFDPDNADFSGMTDVARLFITDVFHKAFVAVDEEGTEAAAATAVVVGTTSIPPEPVVVTIDRPFVFLIRDIDTGTILFLGRVVDPTG